MHFVARKLFLSVLTHGFFAALILLTLFMPALAWADLAITNSQCPPSVCDNTAGGSTFWPGVGNFSICNNTIAPWTLMGFRWKTANFNGFTTFGGPAPSVSGSGPYQYEQRVAASDQVLRAAFCLNSYSLGNPVPAGKNGQPYDFDLLIKNGSCSPVQPFATPTPIACSAVTALSNQAAYYDSNLCVSQSMGKNGGPDSGGLINTFVGQTQIQVARPAAGWSVNTDPIIWDPVVGMGNSPLYLMASAAGQEYLSVDMFYIFGIGSKESKAANIMAGTPLFIPTNAAGVAGTYHVENTTFAAIVGAYPSFFPDYACIATYPDVTTAIGTACYPAISDPLYHYMSQAGYPAPDLQDNSAQLVNSVFAVDFNMYRLYDAMMASTDLCFKKLLEGGSDPLAAVKILPAGYNQGMNSGFQAGALPPSAGTLAATDITSFTSPGNSNYRDDVLRTATNLSNASAACPHSSGVFDPPINLTDLQTFFFGNGGTVGAQGDGGLLRQFALSGTDRTNMWNDVLCAFNLLKGRAPTPGLTASQISYRYDFLTILRVARRYFSLQRPFPTQSDFTTWVVNHSTTNGAACGITNDVSFPYINTLTPAQNSNVCPDFPVTLNTTDNVGVTSVDYTLDPDLLAWNPAANGGGGNYSFIAAGSDPHFPASGPGKLWVRSSDACGNQTIRMLAFNVSCGTPTPTVTPTATRSSTPTASPSATPTATKTASPTLTASPTASPSYSPSSTVTVSPSPSATPSASPSSSPSSTRSASPTLSASPTVSPSSSATLTRSPTLSASPSASPLATNTASPSVTATPSASPSPSPSSTRTATVTVSPTPSPSSSPSFTSSPTAPGTFTDTSTVTFTPTVSPSATVTQSFTTTPTLTATPTVTPTLTPSQTYSATCTRTASPTLTATPTPSQTFSATFTRTASSSSTATATASPTATLSSSFTATPSTTFTPTVSPSFSVTPSFSVSPTITPTTDRYFAQDSLIKVRGLYPNPFSDQLRVYYTLRVDAEVKLDIYNVAGEPIWHTGLFAKAGKNEVIWLGENGTGSRCASGTYVLRMQAEGVDKSVDGFWERAAITR